MTWRVMAVAALACVLSVGCGGVTTPSSNASQDFSGTLVVGGYDSYPFSVGKTGELTLQLTAIAPDANTIVVLGYGQMNGSTCVPFGGYANLTRLNGSPFGAPISVQKGSYCIAVYDAGLVGPLNALTRAETYTVNVTHP